MAQSEQALLYVLRSTTTPLGDKVQRAASALDAAPDSLTLPALIRDWAFDVLLKATRIDSLAPALLDADLWTLTARSTLATQSLNLTTQILPVFVAFVTRYVNEKGAQASMLSSVAAVWTRLAPGAMRKATLEAGLEGYEKLVESSLAVFGSESERSEVEKEAWSLLGCAWLAATRNVVMDAGKGGKRVPTHTLSLLPTVLPLLRSLPPASSFRTSLLQTVQLALFNLENLRRGFARETYTAGGAGNGEASISTVDTEVFAEFRTLGDSLRNAVLVALPAFTRLYFASLATHSTVLFPLPAKSSFPTPSAQKSALEVLGLTKRRESAGRWVRGVIEYLAWSDSDASVQEEGDSDDAAEALEGVLAEVESRDLFRPGQADEAWKGVLAQVTTGCLNRLASVQTEKRREAIMRVLTLTARLDYAAIQPSVARILHALASVNADATGSPASNAFLDYCIEFHSRSLTIPALLEHLSSALAAAYDASTPNNLLTTRTTLERLGGAISSSASSVSAMRGTWDALTAPIRTALDLEAGVHRDSPEPQDAEMSVDGNRAPQKRKRSTVSDSGLKTAAGATRLAAIYLSFAPEMGLAALSSEIDSFTTEIVEDGVKTLCQLAREASSADGSSPAKKVKKTSRRRSESGLHGLADDAPSVVLAVELLELRYTAIERLRRIDLLPPNDGDGPKWYLLSGKRRDGLRLVLKHGQGAEAIVAARSLLQYGELVADTNSTQVDLQETIGAVLTRLEQSRPSSTWTGALRSLPVASIGIALYDLILRRWLRLISRSASSLQLAELARLVVGNIATEANSPPSLLSIPVITHVALRRSDVWEERALREQLLDAIRNAAILPGLSSVQEVLTESEADSKASEARKSLKLDTLFAAARFYRSLTNSVPAEYFGVATRTALVEAALALDLWLSKRLAGKASKVELGDAQSALRGFVLSSGPHSVFTAELASQLLDTTEATARTVTVSLIEKLLINPAVVAAKSESAAAALLAILHQLQRRPLGIKVVRQRGDDFISVLASPSDLATLRLYEALSGSSAGQVDLPMSVRSRVQESIQQSVAAVATVMPFIAETVKSSDLFRMHEALDAIRIVWTAERRFELANSPVDYASFATVALQSGLAQLPSFGAESYGAEVVQSLLGLTVLQAQSRQDLTPTQNALEPALACYLAFQAALPREAWTQLDAGLISVTMASKEADYETSLTTIVRLLATCSVGALSQEETTALLEQLLSTALILLLWGPEGSGRIATAALAEILRDVAVMASNVGDGAAAPACYQAISRFLDSLCAERPLLLSRLNISAVLSLIAVCLRPVVAESTCTNLVAGETLRHFVAATGHIVRHRKDHLVSLFPALMAVTSGFLAVLRIAGLGSLGTSAPPDDASDTSLILGQRAEREAKETFPAWVWAGGRQAVGRNEAKAISRLLGSLGAKTTTTSGGGKRRTTAVDSSASTTSLAAPLSKHAPFLLLNYLRACVHATCPIPSALRSELQGGWFEVMDAMGKWEREALMKGLLGDEEEAERGVLRSMWAAWEKERYRG